MRLGFEIVSARQSPPVTEQPTREPMAANKKIRRNPSEDQKKVRRQQRRNDKTARAKTALHSFDSERGLDIAIGEGSGGVVWLSVDEDVQGSGELELLLDDLKSVPGVTSVDHAIEEGTYYTVEVRGLRRDEVFEVARYYQNRRSAAITKQESTMHTEAQILNAMANAHPDERRVLAERLNEMRREARAARTADRELDMASSIVGAVTTPVRTHERSTPETDWLSRVAAVGASDSDADRIVAEARMWIGSRHEAVLADSHEFREQAWGKARSVTSSFGGDRDRLVSAFMAEAKRLRAEAGFSRGAMFVEEESYEGYTLELNETDDFDAQSDGNAYWVVIKKVDSQGYGDEVHSTSHVEYPEDAWDDAREWVDAKKTASRRSHRFALDEGEDDDLNTCPSCGKNTSGDGGSDGETGKCGDCADRDHTGSRHHANDTEGWDDPTGDADANIERYKGTPDGIPEGKDYDDPEASIRREFPVRSQEPAFGEEFDGGARATARRRMAVKWEEKDPDIYFHAVEGDIALSVEAPTDADDVYDEAAGDWFWNVRNRLTQRNESGTASSKSEAQSAAEGAMARVAGRRTAVNWEEPDPGVYWHAKEGDVWLSVAAPTDEEDNYDPTAGDWFWNAKNILTQKNESGSASSKAEATSAAEAAVSKVAGRRTAMASAPMSVVHITDDDVATNGDVYPTPCLRFDTGKAAWLLIHGPTGSEWLGRGSEEEAVAEVFARVRRNREQGNVPEAAYTLYVLSPGTTASRRRAANESVEVSGPPRPCDICSAATATVDGKTVFGPWANMCDSCHTEVGVGLGLGKGQRLVYTSSRRTAIKDHSGNPLDWSGQTTYQIVGRPGTKVVPGDERRAAHNEVFLTVGEAGSGQIAAELLVDGSGKVALTPVTARRRQAVSDDFQQQADWWNSMTPEQQQNYRDTEDERQAEFNAWHSLGPAERRRYFEEKDRAKQGSGRRQADKGDLTEDGTFLPWELPAEGAETGDGSADVDGTPTPGDANGYPQPTASVNAQRLAAFRNRVKKGRR